jgi:hypothetical protein
METQGSCAMITLDKTMTAREFNDGLKKLGVSVYASANVLGISLRQAQRYSSGEDAVAWRTANHVRLLLLTVAELKKRRSQLLEQIKPLESGTGRIYNGKSDVTKVVLSDVRRQLAQCEDLLTNHPAGVKPGFD